LTGRGDLAAARRAAVSHAAEAASSTDPGELNEVAVVYQLEGQRDRARACWNTEFEQNHDAYQALQLAMLDLDAGDAQAALDRFDQVQSQRGAAAALPPEMAKMLGSVTPPADDTRAKVYEAAVAEVRRCLEAPGGGGAAVPRRDGDVKVILDATGRPYRACAAYFFGRLCELRGRREDAKWWYRASLTSGDWTNSCRPQSAAGLRRLGEEFYK
jgi:hypothetical protein